MHYQTMGYRVADCIDRRDTLPDPVHCWRSTSTWHPTQYSTTTQEHQRWLSPSSYGYSYCVSPRQQAHPSRRSLLLTCTCLCRIAELTPSSGESSKRGTIHPGTVVNTQDVCRQEDGLKKVQESQRWRKESLRVTIREAVGKLLQISRTILAF